MNRKKHVVAGPYRVARKYAESQGWSAEDYVIVTRGHQLAGLDPALILKIFLVKLHSMGQTIADEIYDEIFRVRALWPTLPMVAAA